MYTKLYQTTNTGTNFKKFYIILMAIAKLLNNNDLTLI